MAPVLFVLDAMAELTTPQLAPNLPQIFLEPQTPRLDVGLGRLAKAREDAKRSDAASSSLSALIQDGKTERTAQ